MFDAKKDELLKIEAELAQIDDKELKNRLQKFLEGYKTTGIKLPIGSYVYRARPVNEDFSKNRPIHFSELHMPPPHRTTRQRLNQAGAPIFYSGIAWEGLPYELRSKKGEHLITSSWRLKEEALIIAVGYTKSALQALGCARAQPEWARGEGFAEGANDPNCDKDFLGEMLTRPAKENPDEVYRLTSTMASVLLGRVEGKDNVLAGLIYPTVAMFGNGDNFAFAPWFAQRGLEFAGAREFKIAEFDEEGVRSECVDRSAGVNEAGELMWTGYAGYNPQPGCTYRMTARAGKTDDGFYLRFEDGRHGYWEIATDPEGVIVHKMA